MFRELAIGKTPRTGMTPGQKAREGKLLGRMLCLYGRQSNNPEEQGTKEKGWVGKRERRG